MANKNKYKELALSYFNSSKEIKELQEKQIRAKEKLYAAFDKYFEQNEDEVEDERVLFEYPNIYLDEDENETLVISVKQVQKSTVKFDTSRLEKILNKKYKNDVIKKRYEIFDMKGLITYLKSCDVDPKIFSSFVNVTPSVDVKELERLEQLGKVKLDDLKGCYSVEQQKPYYLVTEKR